MYGIFFRFCPIELLGYLKKIPTCYSQIVFFQKTEFGHVATNIIMCNMTKFSNLGVASGDFFEMTQQFYRAKPKKNSIYVGEYLSICLNHALTMLCNIVHFSIFSLKILWIWPSDHKNYQFLQHSMVRAWFRHTERYSPTYMDFFRFCPIESLGHLKKIPTRYSPLVFFSKNWNQYSKSHIMVLTWENEKNFA